MPHTCTHAIYTHIKYTQREGRMAETKYQQAPKKHGLDMYSLLVHFSESWREASRVQWNYIVMPKVIKMDINSAPL